MSIILYFQARNHITSMENGTEDYETGTEESIESEANASATEFFEPQTENQPGNVEMNTVRNSAQKRKRTTSKDAVDLRVERALDLIEARQNKVNDDEEGTFGNWVGQALRNTKNQFIKYWKQENITKIIHDGKRKSLNAQVSVTTAASSIQSSISGDDDEWTIQ